MKKPEYKLETLKSIRDLQGDHGNWNFDPYSHGMYNALEFAVSIMEDREPLYRDKPDQWLCDKPKSNEPPKASSSN